MQLHQVLLSILEHSHIFCSAFVKDDTAVFVNIILWSGIVKEYILKPPILQCSAHTADLLCMKSNFVSSE